MEVLKNALKSLDFSLKSFFFSIRNEFQPMVHELCNELNLKVLEHTDTICLKLPKQDALKFEISPPKDYHLRSLTLDNLEQINSNWLHRYDGSEKFIEYLIKYHINIGLFDNNNQLVAWCLKYDNGSLAILQVDEQFMNRGFGSLVAMGISKEIAEKTDCDVLSLVLHENQKSINLFKKLGFVNASGHTWFGLINK